MKYIIIGMLGFVACSLVWFLVDIIKENSGYIVRKWWLVLLVDGVLIAGIALTCFAYKIDRFAESVYQESGIEQEENF